MSSCFLNCLENLFRQIMKSSKEVATEVEEANEMKTVMEVPTE